MNTRSVCQSESKQIELLRAELEASRQSRLRAWTVLQDIRAILVGVGNCIIEEPLERSFEAEGAILKKALRRCLRDRDDALRSLSEAARGIDGTTFGRENGLPRARRRLMGALEEAGRVLGV